MDAVRVDETRNNASNSLEECLLLLCNGYLFNYTFLLIFASSTKKSRTISKLPLMHCRQEKLCVTFISVRKNIYGTFHGTQKAKFLYCALCGSITTSRTSWKNYDSTGIWMDRWVEGALVMQTGAHVNDNLNQVYCFQVFTWVFIRLCIYWKKKKKRKKRKKKGNGEGGGGGGGGGGRMKVVKTRTEEEREESIVIWFWWSA